VELSSRSKEEERRGEGEDRLEVEDVGGESEDIKLFRNLIYVSKWLSSGMFRRVVLVEVDRRFRVAYCLHQKHV
jgi:hypothetical protein